MGRRKEEISLPHLNDRGGDLTKDWYVEYGFRDPEDGHMERFRIYKGFEKLDETGRYQLGKKLVEEYTDKIVKGWNPFTATGKLVVVNDETMYHNQASLTGRKTSIRNNITTYYINEFIKYKKPELTIKSHQTYVSKLRKFRLYLDKKKLNILDIADITPNHVLAFMTEVQKAGSLSTATMGKYYQILYSLFDYVKKTKKIKMDNPAEDLPKIGEIKDEAPDPISDRHRKIFSREIPKQDPQLWLACMLMYYTALRPGEEIRLLKIRQFNFANRSITVYRTTAKNNDRETIQMPDHLYNQITKVYHLDKCDDDYFVFGVGGVPGTMTLGKNNMTNRFNRIRDDLNMPKSYKFYSWKHTGASNLTATGLNPYDLQHHLRHKDIQSTQNYIRKRLGDRNDIIKTKFPKI